MRSCGRDTDDPDFAAIRKHARKTLAKFDAVDIYPTPVEHLIESAKIQVEESAGIDSGYLSSLSQKAQQFLKKAFTKVIGVFDFFARIIHIDSSTPLLMRPFLKLHELGHAYLPWQNKIYKGMEECEQTIAPEVSEKFEQEANIFATEVLFKVGAFEEMASADPMSIKVPLRLSKTFGSSVYAAIRRYVGYSHRCCAVIVLNPTEMVPGDGFRAVTRRVLTSQQFDSIFGELEWPDVITPDSAFGKFVPLHRQVMAKRDTVMLTSQDATQHEVMVESFKTKYQTFILILVE